MRKASFRNVYLDGASLPFANSTVYSQCTTNAIETLLLVQII